MALREYRAGIESLLALSPSLRLLDAGTGAAAGEDEEFSETTIFPFTLACGHRALSTHECRAIYQMLAEDLSGVIDCAAADRAVMARRCLVGQPVRIEQDTRPVAALRLCVGARLVTETWSADAGIFRQNLQRQLDAVAEVVAKIELLLALTGERGFTELSHGA
jgi:hypothetical protein